MSKDIKIQPLGKRVLVKPEEIESKTSGGLLIPPSASDDKRPATGEILKLGIGEVDGKKIEFDVKVGDKIFFKKYSPEEIEIEGIKYLIVDVEDILVKLS